MDDATPPAVEAPPPEAPPADAPPAAPPVEAPPVAPPPLPSESPVRVGDLVRVKLVDGQLIRGVVAATDAAWLVLHVADAREVRVAWDAVALVEGGVADRTGTDFAWRDPNVTRFFYAPSAFSLKRGTGYVSQKELLLTTAAYGLTDWLAIEGGTAVPLLFSPTRVGILGVKVGVPVAENVRLGGGTQVFGAVASTDLAVAGFAFANVSIGTADEHVMLGAGQSFVSVDGDTRLGPTPVVLGGNLRVRDQVAIVTENWLLVDPQNTVLPTPLRFVPSGGARFMGERFAVDVGVVAVWIGESEVPLVPIPWLDFTYNFGTVRPE